MELELQQPFGVASENHFALCAGELNLIEKLHRTIIAHGKTVITTTIAPLETSGSLDLSVSEIRLKETLTLSECSCNHGSVYVNYR
jgi:hypothetical protein